jgi:hypothetical protein
MPRAAPKVHDCPTTSLIHPPKPNGTPAGTAARPVPLLLGIAIAGLVGPGHAAEQDGAGLPLPLGSPLATTGTLRLPPHPQVHPRDPRLTQKLRGNRCRMPDAHCAADHAGQHGP